MTKTFERFLRSFDDDELVAFARERARAQPPYWRVMQLALRIEASRRGLRLGDDPSAAGATGRPEADRQTGTA